MNKAELNKPPKVHKMNRTENPEIPFGNVIDMNSVGTRSTNFNPNLYCTYVTIKMKFPFVALIGFILTFSFTADPRLLYKWFTASHMAVHLQGDQQTHQTCHSGPEQRSYAQGTHLSVDPGVQRYTHRGQGELK